MTKSAKIATIGATPIVNLYDASKPVRAVEMPLPTFSSYLRNPRQRQEKARARKRHLQEFVLPHMVFVAAVLPDGTVYKVDGHTRDMLVKMGLLSDLLEDNVIVLMYSVETLDEVKALYDFYDSKEAAKTTQEILQSACAERFGLLKTDWLREGRFSSAMSIAFKPVARIGKLSVKASKKKQVEIFDSAIRIIDDMDLDVRNFPIGVLAALMLSIHKHGTNAVKFWQLYNDGAGSMDTSSGMLRSYLDQQRKDGLMAGDKNNVLHFEQALGFAKRGIMNPSRFYVNRPAPELADDFLR